MDFGFLFTGQGSQYKGMEKKLTEGYRLARETFEEASDILQFDILNRCESAEEEYFADTESMQPLLLVYEVAAYRVFRDEYELKPLYLAGHSLGEIAAITCSSGLTFEKALRLVKERGRLMKKYGEGKGKMLAVLGGTADLLETICVHASKKQDAVAAISNYNSSGQNIVAGNHSGIDSVMKELSKIRIKTMPLKSNVPFHSSIMQECAEEFREYASGLQLDRMDIPVISNVDGCAYTGQEDLGDYLSRHIVSPVQWENSMKYLFEKGLRNFVELGPKDTLSNLLKEDRRDVNTYSLNKPALLQLLETRLKKDRIDMLKKEMALVVSERNGIYDRNAYQAEVASPYKELRSKLMTYMQENRLISREEADEFRFSISKILNAKKTGSGT